MVFCNWQLNLILEEHNWIIVSTWWKGALMSMKVASLNSSVNIVNIKPFLPCLPLNPGWRHICFGNILISDWFVFNLLIYIIDCYVHLQSLIYSCERRVACAQPGVNAVNGYDMLLICYVLFLLALWVVVWFD